MAEEEPKTVEVETETPLKQEPFSHPEPEPPLEDEKAKKLHSFDDDQSSDLKLVPVNEDKIVEHSGERDSFLANVASEKKFSLIKAWEENQKCKAENKAHKQTSLIGSWENTQKAALDAELKKLEEKIEKKKAEQVEKMKNKIAHIHKTAEEKRAIVEAKRGEDLHKAKEVAAKYRATGTMPKKILGCF